MNRRAFVRVLGASFAAAVFRPRLTTAGGPRKSTRQVRRETEEFLFALGMAYGHALFSGIKQELDHHLFYGDRAR